MNSRMDEVIRSLDVTLNRDLEAESSWCYNKYSDDIDEALNYFCPDANVSIVLRHQISQMIHQGYVVVNEIPYSIPVRSIYVAIEKVVNEVKGRGRLNNVTSQVGFEVEHIHVGQSSSIIENWVNHARKTKLESQPFTKEVIFENLMSSLSKSNKTGEWLVYSKSDTVVEFWCLWLHSAGDECLIDILNRCRA